MYNLYPLLSGFVALPPLQLKATSTDPLDQNVLDELVNRYVPTHIYVLVRNRAVLVKAIILLTIWLFIFQPQAKEKKNAGAASGQSSLLRSE